jgi:histidinol-phosphate aminotransferase
MIADPELIDAVFTTKNSFNHFPVDALTQKIGIASCDDALYYKQLCSRIGETRDEFSAQLRNAGWDVLPSMANFVFVRKNGLAGEQIYNEVKSRGILIRYFNKPEDMQTLFEIMQGIDIN